MSGVDVSIDLPVGETPGELIKGYFTLMRALGWDLYVTSHFALKDELGLDWFSARIKDLKASDPRNWRPTHRFDPQDPSSILRDYVFERDSPYLDVFGSDWRRISEAKKILSTRNIWFHFGDDPTLGQLREAAQTAHGFVTSSGLHIGPRIDQLLGRLNDLASGRYSGRPYAIDLSGAGSDEVQQIDAPVDLARPRIGGTWVGDVPAIRYRLSPTGDVLHPHTMKSLGDAVEGDFRAKVRAWTAVRPRGGELWVDRDGAVGGFIGPTPRLLGYLGPDPENEVARGFFTPHFYVRDGSDVVDVDSGERRQASFANKVSQDAVLRVTTYGDVVVIDESNGIERVTVVTPDTWFPGHLG